VTELPADPVDCVFREFQRLDPEQRALLLRRMWCGEARTPPVTVDEVILKALEGGPVTVNDVTNCFRGRARIKLEKLRVRGIVVRASKGRAHREFTYTLVLPRIAAKAIGKAGGGLSRGAKPTPDHSPTVSPPTPAN
jgi:hypothetical protein